MSNFYSNLLTGFGINDAIDILITAFIIYKLLGFIQETRAQQLVKGLGVVILVYFLSDVLDLHVLNWILRGAFTIGAFALVVVFQPELRRALEHVGRTSFGINRFSKVDKDQAKYIVDEITEAVGHGSETRTGMLIVFERQTTLEDIAETGTKIDARISAEMLGNIFYEGAPLHDGACLIRADRIYAAGCVLPLTSNRNLHKSLGTRHRAGIGITENSDALVLVVSEETGIISIAEDGRLRRYLDTKEVEKQLLNLYITEDHGKNGRFGGHHKNQKKG